MHDANKKRRRRRKPGRPAGRTGEQRRFELLEAARDLATLKSISEITLAEVAGATGVAPPLARYYFGNRKGLQRALIDHMINNMLPKIRELAETKGPIEKRLRTLIKGWLKGLSELDGVIQVLLTHVLFPSDEATERFVRDFARPVVSLIRPLVEQGVSEGKFRRVEYMFFHSAVIGACLFFVASQPQTAPAYDYHKSYEESLEGFGTYIANLFVDHLLIK